MSKAGSIILYLGALLTALQGWFLLTVLFGGWFTINHSAAWLVPAALLIDGYFGAFYEFPKLTAAALLWFIISELMKPLLLWHNEE